MAEKYEQVLEALRQISAEKLEEAEAAFKERSGWLAQAVADAKVRFTAAKQAHSQGDSVVDKENVKQPAPKRGGRSRRKPALLETVEEEATEPADKDTAAEPAGRNTPAGDKEVAAGEGSAEQPEANAALANDFARSDSREAGLATAVEPEPQKRSERGRGKKAEPVAAQEPPPAAPVTRATRSRSGATAEASAKSVTQFPSPPKARKGRGRAKKVKEPTPAPSKVPDPPAATTAEIASHKLSLEPSPAGESPLQTAQLAEEAGQFSAGNQESAGAGAAGHCAVREDAAGEGTPADHPEAPVSKANMCPAETRNDADVPVPENETEAAAQLVVPESDAEEEAPAEGGQGGAPDAEAQIATHRDSGVASQSAFGTPAAEVGLAQSRQAPPSSLASRATRQTIPAAAETPAAVPASGPSPPRTRSRLHANSTQNKLPGRSRRTPATLHASTAKQLETATPGDDKAHSSNTPADTSVQPHARPSVASPELALAEQAKDGQELQQGTSEQFRGADGGSGQDAKEVELEAVVPGEPAEPDKSTEAGKPTEPGEYAEAEVQVPQSSGVSLEEDIAGTQQLSCKPSDGFYSDGGTEESQVPSTSAAVLGGEATAKLAEGAGVGKEDELVPESSNEAEPEADLEVNPSPAMVVGMGTQETVYYTQDAQELALEDEETEEREEADEQEVLQEPDAAPQDKEAGAQLGGGVRNLVSSIRSFLPAASKSEAPAAGKKAPEVEALKAAQAARRREAAKEAERLKQKEALNRQKADRAKHTNNVKAKQEAAQKRAADEAKRREEALKKKEEEAASRRRAKEEAEKKEREERQRKLDELRAKKRQEEARKKEERQEDKKDAGRKRAAEDDKPKGKVESQIQELEAKRARVETATASQTHLPAAHLAAQSETAPKVALAKAAASAAPPSAQSAASQEPPPLKPALVAPAAAPIQPTAPAAPALPESIEIAPYRSDEDTDEEEEQQKQMLPAWAQEPALRRQLLAQQRLDPDEIFQQHQKTCSLDEVFDHASTGRDPKGKDFNRRSSSGNWLEDRVTWKEEMNYKKAMGYI